MQIVDFTAGHNFGEGQVNRADVHKLEGIVTLGDVLDAYGVSRA